MALNPNLPNTKPAKSPTPAISVSATHLAGEFASNILRAKKIYGDRPMRVSGNLDYFTKSGSTISLRFVIPGVDEGVEATLEEGHYAGLEDVDPRQRITLLCDEVTEGAITPKLHGCSYIPDDAPVP